VEDDGEAVLQESSRYEKIAQYVSQLQSMCMGHNVDIKKLESEVHEGRSAAPPLPRPCLWSPALAARARSPAADGGAGRAGGRWRG